MLGLHRWAGLRARKAGEQQFVKPGHLAIVRVRVMVAVIVLVILPIIVVIVNVLMAARIVFIVRIVIIMVIITVIASCGACPSPHEGGAAWPHFPEFRPGAGGIQVELCR